MLPDRADILIVGGGVIGLTLARELAATTGESITVATRVAIEERLARERRASVARRAGGTVNDIIERGRARRTRDERPEAEILGYDHEGLPS